MCAAATPPRPYGEKRWRGLPACASDGRHACDLFRECGHQGRAVNRHSQKTLIPPPPGRQHQTSFTYLRVDDNSAAAPVSCPDARMLFVIKPSRQGRSCAATLPGNSTAGRLSYAQKRRGEGELFQVFGQKQAPDSSPCKVICCRSSRSRSGWKNRTMLRCGKMAR